MDRLRDCLLEEYEMSGDVGARAKSKGLAGKAKEKTKAPQVLRLRNTREREFGYLMGNKEQQAGAASVEMTFVVGS